MKRLDRTVALLRVVLVVAFLALLAAQTLVVPGTLAYQAAESPEDAYLRWPLLVFLVLELLCAQVVIVCTWRLLTMVRDDVIFSDTSLVWVDTIVGAIAAAWLLLAVAFGYFAVTADDPGTPVLLLLLLIAVTVLGLLVVVMRALLRQATALRTDMEAVI